MKLAKILALAITIISFTITNAQTKKINTEKSKLTWVGKKVTGKHEGTVNFKEGNLIFKAGKLKGGNFTVDMTTINATDLEGEYQQKLNGHLKAEDFFGTDKYPTSKLVIKKIANLGKGKYKITADLTIKDITLPNVFEMQVNKNNATASVKVDRTKYGIKYNSGSIFSGLGDKTIDDIFELNVNLVY